jgi:hypothetical protein
MAKGDQFSDEYPKLPLDGGAAGIVADGEEPTEDTPHVPIHNRNRPVKR